MNEQTREYLVLSRGQWDKDASKEDIEAAIHQFYEWLARNIEAGKMKMGSRLSRERAVVSKTRTRLPFARSDPHHPSPLPDSYRISNAL